MLHYIIDELLHLAGDIHIATWKPDLVRVWKVSLKYTNQERAAESKSGLDALKVLEVEVNSSQSFVPSLNGLEKSELLNYFSIDFIVLNYPRNWLINYMCVNFTIFIR